MLLKMQIHSEQLKMNTQINMIALKEREGEPMNVLWLLHGRGENYTSWMRQTMIEGYQPRFHAHLSTPGVEHLYEESEGSHNWKFWDLHIRDGIKQVMNGTSAGQQ